MKIQNPLRAGDFLELDSDAPVNGEPDCDWENQFFTEFVDSKEDDTTDNTVKDGPEPDTIPDLDVSDITTLEHILSLQ